MGRISPKKESSPSILETTWDEGIPEGAVDENLIGYNTSQNRIEFHKSGKKYFLWASEICDVPEPSPVGFTDNFETDWNITGIFNPQYEEGGSKRCQFTGQKLMLYAGNPNLTDSEVISEIKLYTSSTNNRGSLWLRATANGYNGYRLLIYGPRTYYIQKLVDGVVTSLGIAYSSQPYSIYVKTRFRVDGYQLSVDEYVGEAWTNISTIIDTESTHASGYAGIGGNSVNTSYFCLHDNVSIGVR